MGKRIVLWGIICCCLVPPAWAEELWISYFSDPGHIGIAHAGQRPQGPLVELLEDHISARMGVALKWQDHPSNIPRIIDSLIRGRVDLTPLLVYTEERAKAMAFTAKPYYRSQPAIVVRADSPLTAVEGLEDILDLTIGYARGTFVSPFMRDPKIRFDMNPLSDFMISNLKKVAGKRIDAAYAPDKVGLLMSIRALGMDGRLRCINLPEKTIPFYVVFSPARASDGWVEKYNAAFDVLEADKLYLKLLLKYVDAGQL